MVKGQFKEISLADYKGKYVVLFFYPLDFTFVCPTEIIAFSDRSLALCLSGVYNVAHSGIPAPRRLARLAINVCIINN